LGHNIYLPIRRPLMRAQGSTTNSSGMRRSLLLTRGYRWPQRATQSGTSFLGLMRFCIEPIWPPECPSNLHCLSRFRDPASAELRTPRPGANPADRKSNTFGKMHRAIRNICRSGDQTKRPIVLQVGLNNSKALERHLTSRFLQRCELGHDALLMRAIPTSRLNVAVWFNSLGAAHRPELVI
jgi:hypothetical protein